MTTKPPIYLTQMRSTENGATNEWHDICQGHKTMLEAMECHDDAQAIMDETRPPKTILDLVILHSARRRRKKGIVDETQIVKRTVTVTDEVVEEHQPASGGG